MRIMRWRRISSLIALGVALVVAAPDAARADTVLLPMPGAYSCTGGTNAAAQSWALRPISVTTSATVISGEALLGKNPASHPTAIDIRADSGVGTSSWPIIGTLTQSNSTASGSEFLASYTGSISLTPGTYWIAVREVTSSGSPFQYVCNTTSPSAQTPWSVYSALSPNYYYTGDNGTSYMTTATIPEVPFISLSAASPASEAASPHTAPPSIVQEFGKPSSTTCDVAAPSTLNWSAVDSGGWSESWGQWMNAGKGGAVCTRTLVYGISQGKWRVG